MATKQFVGWGIRLLLFIVVCSVGLGTGALLFAPTTPVQLQEASDNLISPVTPREIDDGRSVELTFEMESPTPLRSATSGLVTAVECAPGSVLTSGTSVLAVDGHPIVSLNTVVPLWRDLHDGDKGEDVLALQSELSRLGYGVFPDGEVGEWTLAAVANLLNLDEEVSDDFQLIQMSSFLWLPGPEMTVRSCVVGVGEPIEAGMELFVLDDALAAARLVEIPLGMLPGERTLVVEEHPIPIDENGMVTDQQGLADLQGTNSFHVWATNQDEAPTVRGKLVLTQPAKVYSVAPAAVYAMDGNAGCMRTESESLPVTIISSELGQTLVSFEKNETIPQTVLLSSQEGPSCR